jgi:hypothetical protein
MRGPILGATVGLDLGDSAQPLPCPVDADQASSHQAPRGLDDGSAEEVVQVDRGAQRYLEARSDGVIQPKSTKKSGISDER